MVETLACIEITSDSAKLLVGYSLGDLPVVIYTAEKKIPGLVNNGQIVSVGDLSKALQSFHTITDPTALLKINVSQVCLVLPPLGFQAYQNNKTTNVVATDGVIAKVDISNLVSLVRKENVPNGNDIVDIIPDEFDIDKGLRFANPPVGEHSNSITIKAKIHTLPMKLLSDYRGAVEKAGFRIKKCCIEPYCIAELFRNYKDMPKDYVYVDMGAHITTLSFIGGNCPYSSLSFMRGGDELSKEIAETFQISFESANALKERYGLDRRATSFQPDIAESNGADGSTRLYNESDLNNVIDGYLKEYFSNLKISLGQLLQRYGSALDRLPLVLGGGGARLFGLVDEYKKVFPNRSILRCVPRSIGARDERYANLLGLVMAASIYRGTLEDNSHGMLNLDRDESAAPSKTNGQKPEPGDDIL